MQQLYFHPTWEKAISELDRTLIETVFEQTYTDTADLIMSPTVRVATNYKNELLIMVLVHNFTHHSTRFNNRLVYAHCGDEFDLQKSFTISDLVVAPFTSMPWTFIFEPNEAYNTLDLSKFVLEIE